MPFPNGFPIFSGVPISDGGFAWFVGTVSSGTVTKVAGDCTCGNFSSGVAAVTFPACQQAIPMSANENTDSDTPGDNHDLKLVDVSATAGTANLRSRSFDATPAANEAPADGTISFCIALSW